MRTRTFYKIILILLLSVILTTLFYTILFGAISYGVDVINYKELFQELWNRSFGTVQVISFVSSLMIIDIFKDDIKWYFYQIILHLGFKKDFRNKMIKFLWQ